MLLLATKGVLTRPWCLIELLEAVTRQIPVLVVEVRGAGSEFDADDARGLAADLESELERLNPGAVSTLRTYLGDDLQPVGRALQTVLSAADQAAPLAWHPHASAEAGAAAARDICERMAQLTGQTLDWQGHEPTPFRSAASQCWMVCAATGALSEAETLSGELSRAMGSRVTVGSSARAAAEEPFDGLVVLLTEEVLLSSVVLLLVCRPRPRSAPSWAFLLCVRLLSPTS